MNKIDNIIVVKTDEPYLAELSFVIEQKTVKDIKNYLDFRNKLDKLELYYVDTDTGSKKRKQYEYIYIWTMCEEDKDYENSYGDYLSYLKLKFPQYSKKISYDF